MAKLLYIDTETTGLDPEKCDIIQLAGIIEIDGKEEQSFMFNIKPKDDCQWTQEAIEKHKINKELAMNYFTSREETLSLLTKYMSRFCKQDDYYDRFFMVGYNIKFDEKFIRKFFAEMTQSEKFFNKWFWFPSIDVAQIVALRTLEARDQFNNFKLETVCQAMGIDFDANEAHNAMFDIIKTRELFLKVIGKE